MAPESQYPHENLHTNKINKKIIIISIIHDRRLANGLQTEVPFGLKMIWCQVLDPILSILGAVYIVQLTQ